MLYFWPIPPPGKGTHEPWKTSSQYLFTLNTAAIVWTSVAPWSCPISPPFLMWLQPGPSAALCPPQLPLCWQTSETVSNWPNQFVADANKIVGKENEQPTEEVSTSSDFIFTQSLQHWTTKSLKLVVKYWRPWVRNTCPPRKSPVRSLQSCSTRKAQHHLTMRLNKELERKPASREERLRISFREPMSDTVFSLHIIFQNDAIYCNIFRTFSKRQIGQKCA